jgi:death-on-curing protein
VKSPVWVLHDAVLAVQEQLPADFGGESGLRDAGLLDSALARPENRFAYKRATVFVFELAAACAFGLVKNHPFIDGNKRIALATAIMFLELNGYRFEADEADAVIRTLALAAGDLKEAEYSRWIGANSTLHPSVREASTEQAQHHASVDFQHVIC